MLEQKAAVQERLEALQARAALHQAASEVSNIAAAMVRPQAVGLAAAVVQPGQTELAAMRWWEVIQVRAMLDLAEQEKREQAVATEWLVATERSGALQVLGEAAALTL